MSRAASARGPDHQKSADAELQGEVRTIMHANTYFCIVILGGELANVLHWGAERGEQFHYLPQSGWPWITVVFLIAATIAGTFLHLTGIATSPNLLWLLCAFTSFQAIYSIAHRHQLRKQKYLQQVIE